MSDSSLLKALPDFTPERILYILRQPLTIAFLASIGVHGLLGIGLPLLSSEETTADEKGAVSLIELSPQERSQVPPASLAQPFPSLLPQQPSPQPTLTPTHPSPFPTIGSSDLYKYPLTPPGPTFNYPETSSPIIIPSIIRPVPVQPSPQSTPSPSPTAGTAPSPSPTVSTSPSAKDLQGTQEATPDSSPASSPTPNPTDPAQAQKIALEQFGTFNEAGTTREATLASINGVLATQKISYDDLKDRKPSIQRQLITAVYPKDACPFKLERQAAIGVLIQPDGKPAAEPQVITSSGFKGLDAAAIQYVKEEIIAKNKIEANGKYYQLPIFPFEFKPTAAHCPPGTTPQAPSSPPAASPAPPPAN